MKCSYCEFINISEEHRCQRCGRRLLGTVKSASAQMAGGSARVAVRAVGANALAAQLVTNPVPEKRSEPQAVARPVAFDTARTLDELPRRALQPSLFGAELQPKIIPFDTLPRAAAVVAEPIRTEPGVEPEAKPAKPRRAANPSTKKDVVDAQTTLDFRPPAKPAGRTLKTNAEAVIYCDARVAAPVHRATAAALDASMVLLAFGVMLGTFLEFAHPGPFSRQALLVMGGLLVLTGLLYDLVFAIAGTITPGLRWTNLRLINFDGFAPDWRSRALRLTGYWISALSGGLGLLWALVDEENLTWHDHISKTFPTLRESESVIVRHTA